MMSSAKKVTRKLLNNFLKIGRITTTEKRVKILRTQAEIMINKAKRNAQSDKNYLLSKLADRKTVEILTVQIAPVFKNRVGGYVRIVKLARRDSDGAKIARLEWTEPVVLEQKIETKKTVPKVKAKVKKTSAKGRSSTGRK